MAENIFHSENLPAYVNAESREYLFTSQYQLSGHPVETNGNVTPMMIPVNFVPLGRQLNIFHQAGYQGFAFNVIPGRYVFIPQNSYQDDFGPATNDGQLQSIEWNRAFLRISELTDNYMGRNRITHYTRTELPQETHGNTRDDPHSDLLDQQTNLEYHGPINLAVDANSGIPETDHSMTNFAIPATNQNLDSLPISNIQLSPDAQPFEPRFSQQSYENHTNMTEFSDSTLDNNQEMITNETIDENMTMQYGSLHDIFQELLHLYFDEANQWIQAVIFHHSRQTRTRSLLGVISSLVSENFITVLQTILNGFISGVLMSQSYTLRQITETLQTVERTRTITSNLALNLRAHSRIFNIFLSPTRLLGRFAQVVNSTTRWMLVNQTSSIPNVLPCPGTRRRTRERNSQQTRESSPERRAFQPPHMMTSQIHPASLPSGHHRTGQRPIIMEQMPVTAPVSMTPFAIPVCTGPHHIPVCTTAHIPVCNSQATWSFPACSVPLPTCNMQHIPACSLPQIPFPHHTFPPLFAHPHNPANHIPRQQHVSPPTTQFTANNNQPHHHHHYHPAQPQHHQPLHQRQEEEIQMIPDHRQAFQVPLHHPHGATPFTASPPVVLQEPNVHPTPHELYGPFQRHYARPRMGGRSGRLRSIPLPPPPYPGFLLHFLAMLSNPPIPHLGRDFNDEATEVENYEALLNLAERLGDAKPKGLTKPEIEQLPAYRFNKENHNSDMDQTSCVVCMCDFENRQLLRVLPCSHEFHAKCVDKWLKTNRTCPICRADATEVAQSD